MQQIQYITSLFRSNNNSLRGNIMAWDWNPYCIMNNSLVRSMYTWQWSNYSLTTLIIDVIVIGSLGVLAAITKSYLFVGILLVFFSLDATPSTVKQSSPCLFSLCLLLYGNSFLQGSTLVLLLPEKWNLLKGIGGRFGQNNPIIVSR